jgi:hypothetical protein
MKALLRSSRLLAPTLCCLTLCCLTLLACAQLNVRHLQRSPWKPSIQQTLTLKYWRFVYEPVPMADAYGIRGTALPVRESLPEWATGVEELWFAVYLSDSHGRVLAKDVQVLLPRELTPDTAIPIEFVLKPEEIGGSEQLFVSFGYRTVISGGEDPNTGAPRILFANEGALTR